MACQKEISKKTQAMHDDMVRHGGPFLGANQDLCMGLYIRRNIFKINRRTLHGT